MGKAKAREVMEREKFQRLGGSGWLGMWLEMLERGERGKEEREEERDEAEDMGASREVPDRQRGTHEVLPE